MSIAFARQSGVRIALRLEAITIAWMLVEAALSIGAGVVAHSALLLAFGIDSVIELVSAFVLYWRLQVEARGAGVEIVDVVEKRASKIAAWLLFTLAAYVVVFSAYKLWMRSGADESYVGMAVALVAAAFMPMLAKRKIVVAEQIGSAALRADGIETLTCGRLAQILLVGLIANALLHWWWLDAAGALVLVPLLIKEGREALSGECACHGSAGGCS